jgi:hypothetical protein
MVEESACILAGARAPVYSVYDFAGLKMRGLIYCVARDKGKPRVCTNLRFAQTHGLEYQRELPSVVRRPECNDRNNPGYPAH